MLVEDYCVDETRVYATGMSGGGLFTSQLVCEMSDRVAVAVSVAAISYPESCDPVRPVPLIFYEVIGGGHAWPSSPLAEPDSPVVAQLTALQGNTTFDINATTDARAFFEQHALEG